MKNTTVTVAWTFAAVIMGISIFGCIGNSLPGEKIFSISCKIYSFIHITTAIGFAVIAWLGGILLVPSLQIFGLSYMLISGVAFMGMDLNIGEKWESVILLNSQSYLLFALGITFSLAGSVLKKRQCLVDT